MATIANTTLSSSPGSSDIMELDPVFALSTSFAVDTLPTLDLNAYVTCHPVYACVTQGDSAWLDASYTSCTRRPLWIDLAPPSAVGVLVTARSYSQLPNLTSPAVAAPRDLFPFSSPRNCSGEDCNGNGTATVTMYPPFEGRLAVLWTPFPDQCAQQAGLPLSYTLELQDDSGQVLEATVTYLGFFPHLQVRAHWGGD